MDNKEFEQLYKRYAPMLYRTAYRMVKNDADALDIVQDAFIRIFNSFTKFRNEANVQTWMYRIVMNLCYDYFRKRKKVLFVSEKDISDYDNNQQVPLDDNVEKITDLENQRKQNLQMLFLL